MKQHLLTFPVAMVFASCFAANSATAQSTPPDRKTESKLRFQSTTAPLLDASAEKEAEAKNLLRLKKFAEAEAACREAIRILEPLSFGKGSATSLLGAIWVSSGRYEEADELFSDLWPDVRPTVSPTYLYWAVALARTGQVDKGLRVILDRRALEPGMLWAKEECLPIADAVTADNVEATAWILLSRKKSGYHEEDHPVMLEWMQRALSLAPENAACHITLARFLERVKRDFDKAMPHYRKAHALGSERFRKEAILRFEANKVPF